MFFTPTKRIDLSLLGGIKFQVYPLRSDIIDKQIKTKVMADNMGGISDAWFAFSRQIASVSQEADKVKVGLKSGDWINLHPGRYGTSIKNAND